MRARGWTILFIILVGIGIGFYLKQGGFALSPTSDKGAAVQNAKSIDWKLLHQLDYKTGVAPEEVKAIDHQMVKIPGFIVPLSDNYSILEEFLLVPDAQSCIHVPPPPPNLIVHVKLKKPIPSEQVVNPAWITGVIRIETTNSQYGASSYQMEGYQLEKFDW